MYVDFGNRAAGDFLAADKQVARIPEMLANLYRVSMTLGPPNTNPRRSPAAGRHGRTSDQRLRRPRAMASWTRRRKTPPRRRILISSGHSGEDSRFRADSRQIREVTVVQDFLPQ